MVSFMRDLQDKRTGSPGCRWFGGDDGCLWVEEGDSFFALRDDPSFAMNLRRMGPELLTVVVLFLAG